MPDRNAGPGRDGPGRAADRQGIPRAGSSQAAGRKAVSFGRGTGHGRRNAKTARCRSAGFLAGFAVGRHTRRAKPAVRVEKPAPVFDDDIPEVEKPEPPPPPAPPPKLTAAEVRRLPPVVSHEPPVWRRHLHWLLVLALLPLVVLLLTRSEQPTFEERLAERLEELSPEELATFAPQLDQAGSLDDLLMLLPGQRLKGALLARGSGAHWLMALLATIAYMTFFMFLAAGGVARPLYILATGLFTATIGITFLFMIQFLAALSEGYMLIGFSVVTLIFYLFRFVAYSYQAADDPENGFVASFAGYTLGVGLCEEFVKSMPVFFYRDSPSGSTWRGLMIAGLASGAGFGIAEGIMYSSAYYNGIDGLDVYLVRFLSCVALHAIWTGSVAISLHLRRDSFEGIEIWYEWLQPWLIILAIPAVLHGLYDTCLKKDLDGYALVVSLASFAWLAFLLSRLQTDDDKQAHKTMLREYVRHRSAIT